MERRDLKRKGGVSMAENRNRASWLSRLLVLATLAILTAFGLSSAPSRDVEAQEAKAKKKATQTQDGLKNKKQQKAQKKEEYAAKAVAIELREALIDLQRAVQDERTPREPLPKRPAKTSSASQLTSSQIDELIAKAVKSEDSNVLPVKRTDDEAFLRRVYFDVIGKPPTIQQIQAFVANKDRDKRSKVIDDLLDDPEYSRNWARYWRDVIQFRASNQQRNKIRYPVMEDWLVEQFEKNASWDEIAKGLITAKGVTDENGPANFLMAHDAEPVEIAGEVSRIFMGLQIQCAQCHDHPYDSWKREQFHQFAAFFAGLRDRPIFVDGMVRRYEIDERGREVYQMPDQNDPTKLSPIAPKFTLVSATKADQLPVRIPMEDKRTLAASYVTGQDNPWFSKAYVNRIWSVLVGEGFYNPIDDLGQSKDVQALEVLDALAADFSKTGYDIKQLFRLILNTKTYQNEIRSTNTAAGRTAFAANCSSRLRSDQIYDALAHALGFPADGPITPPGRGRAGLMAARQGAAGNNITGATMPMGGGAGGMYARMQSPRNRFDFLFGSDPSVPPDEALGTIPQALAMMNSPQINQMIAAKPTTILGKLLTSTPDNSKAVQALYMHVLARDPEKAELQTCLKHIQSVGNRAEAFEDILWSLINSAEFISRK